MPRRSRHRIGDWLVRDDESGEVRYRSELSKRWDGLWVQRKGWETRQPQEFVTADTDPKPVTPVRPDEPVEIPLNAVGVFIGNTNVPVPTNNAAAHLYNPGIGTMRVGFDFYIR